MLLGKENFTRNRKGNSLEAQPGGPGGEGVSRPNGAVGDKKTSHEEKKMNANSLGYYYIPLTPVLNIDR